MGRFHHFLCGGRDNQFDEFHKRRPDKAMVGNSGVCAANCINDHSDLHYHSNSEENKGWTESCKLTASKRTDQCLLETQRRLLPGQDIWKVNLQIQLY